MRKFSALLLLAIAFVATNAARADVTLVGVAVISGDASDLSELKGKTSDGTPLNRLGGLGSAIAYSGKGEEYIFASDRGPKDGTVEFPCRYHRMSIRVKPGTKEPVSLKLTATTLLTNESGTAFNGSLSAFEHKHAEKNLRLDPEGIRASRTGTFFISDEYGPVVYEFDAKGKRLQSLPVPAHFQIPKPGKSPNDELPPKTTIGRQPNRGMEGLAISPDGTKLYGAMQSPLIQDGALNEKNERIGVNCRILEIDLATKKTREFVYQLDSPANGVCEILAVNDHEFLVLERDSLGGKDAAFKKVFLIDITGATDVGCTATLPAKQLPATVTAVKKKPFLDLLAKKYKIAGGDCPEKFEGLAFGPALPDNRTTLIVTADNDFITEKPFQVYAFAIDKSDLPNFQPQQFGSKK